MHLVSRVVGELRQDLDVLHAYRACMNMGTLSGAPKVRAMQLIAAAEGKRRGSYGGAVGYFTAHGDLDTCIVIRSAYVQEGIATVRAGAGIVLDSVPQSEADETRNKSPRGAARHCPCPSREGDFLMADILLLDNIDSFTYNWQTSCAPAAIT